VDFGYPLYFMVCLDILCLIGSHQKEILTSAGRFIMSKNIYRFDKTMKVTIESVVQIGTEAKMNYGVKKFMNYL
jgi:hypothetical protein